MRSNPPRREVANLPKESLHLSGAQSADWRTCLRLAHDFWLVFELAALATGRILFSNGLGGWRWGRFGESTTQVEDYRVGFAPHGKTRLRANVGDGDHSVHGLGPFCSIPRRAKDFLPVIRGE